MRPLDDPTRCTPDKTVLCDQTEGALPLLDAVHGWAECTR
jgi:hypothetical protein